MVAPEPDDPALLDGCLKGDPLSWDRFVRRFAGLVRWSVLRTLSSSALAGDEQAAAEIFQEVFRGLLEKRSLERLRRAEHLRKFLCVIAAHATVDHLRRVTRERRLGSVWLPEAGGEEAGEDARSAPEIPSPAPPPDQEARDAEFRAALEELLEALPGRERACFEWHYLEGRTHEAIAFTLGIPRDTVSTVIRRTREKLRRLLADRGIDAG